MKIEDSDGWAFLCELQRELKKQFLLVEKEQQQKIKLKREIEQSIRSHHSLSIEIREPKAHLLKDEGFGNCYNFIKDVIIGISLEVQLGRQVVFLAEEHSSLIYLIIHTFYENVQTNDPFLKDVTKLMHKLMGELFHAETSQSYKLRIVDAWKCYMEKLDHEHYFEQISNPTLKQLLKEEKKINRNSTSEKQIEDDIETYEYGWQVKNKDQLVQQFIENLEKEAALAPASIKIPLKAAYNSSDSEEEARVSRIWQLLSSFYLKPFKNASTNPAVPQHLRQRILNFIDDLISRCRFFSELSHQNIGYNKVKGSAHNSSIERVCRSVLEINEERYRYCFLQKKQASTHSIQIKIVGGCLNLEQLSELLVLLNSHKQAFGRISQRIVHRTQRIFQMSPDLQILRRDKAQFQYVSLAELNYEESISSDYYKTYSNTYRTETIKQILKQVLVQLQGLGDYRTSQSCGFAQIFSSIVQRSFESRNRNGLSAQLQMKVKYLIYLLVNKEKDEAQIMRQMIQELGQRNSVNFKLFQDTKFSLLKVYCNLRNLKLQLRGKQDGERRSRVKLQLLEKIEHFRLDFCLSSRASRNKTQGEQAIDQYRYRMSSADQIMLAPIDSCIHKDNPFTGTYCHAHNISKFLKIFTSLPQVRYFIGNPSFLASEHSAYSYCSQNKIKEAFLQFTVEVIERLKLVEQQRGMLEGILYRKLTELLLGKVDSPYLFPKDRQLLDQMQSKMASVRYEQSPRKSKDSPRKRNHYNNSNRKRRGSETINEIVIKLHQVPLKSTSYEQTQLDQLVQIGARHISSIGGLSSPLEKVRKLKEMLDIYKMVIDKSNPKAAQTIQRLLVNSVIAARLPNLISTLSFLQIFLPEEKLMSSQGMVLKQLERAAMKVLEGAHRGRRLERSRMPDC